MNYRDHRWVRMRSGRRVVVGAGVTLALVVAGCSTSGTTAKRSTTLTTKPAGGPCAQPGLPTTVPYKALAGVDVNLTSLDVHAPADVCGAPVVVWVHGGAYRTGDKANQMGAKVRLFNDRGWILVSVNYRLTRPGQPSSAQYPDHYDDVAAALAWVHNNIAGYGGDASRIALLGHSAGADIVSNVVTNPTYLQQNGLALDAVRCAGPLDTEGFDKRVAGADDPDGERQQWQVALGNNPDYLAETSATNLIKPGIGIPPMIGVVRGTQRRQQIEMTFLDTLTAVGIAATTIDARSLTHGQVNSRIGASGDSVMTPPLVTFLTSCFQR
jgi:arylformamidase